MRTNSLNILYLRVDEVRPYDNPVRNHNRAALRKLRKLIGFHPNTQSVLPTEDLNTGDTRNTGQFVLQVDDGVIGQKIGTVPIIR